MRLIANIFLLFMTVSAIASSNSPKDSIKTVSLRGSRVEIPKKNRDKCPELIINNNILISQLFTHYVSTLTPQKWDEQQILFDINEFPNVTIAKGTDRSLMILNTPGIGNQLSSLTVIKETDNLKSIKEKNKWKNYDLSGIQNFRLAGCSFVSLPNNSLLVTGATLETKHLFSIIDYKKQEATPLEYWPKDGINCTNLVKQSVYTDNCRLDGNGNGRFLYQCKWSRLAFIFTIEGENINIVKELYSDYHVYKSDEEGLNYIFSQKTTTYERFYCTTNNNRIYVLLLDSDRKGKKFDKYVDSYIYGNTVVEYDWEGNKKRTIHLDHFGRDILLSDDNKTLYLMTNDHFNNVVPRIWSYDISNLDSLPDIEP